MGADLATSLLAEGRRSRFVQHLREELQIVESIDMDVTILEQGCLVMLEASCSEKHVEYVEEEIHNMLLESITTLPSKQEIERASQLVRNGLCFSLEAPSQVAALVGAQALWNRPQPLLKPLNHLNTWTASRIQKEMLPLFQPERSYTLIAKPAEDD